MNALASTIKNQSTKLLKEVYAIASQKEITPETNAIIDTIWNELSLRLSTKALANFLDEIYPEYA